MKEIKFSKRMQIICTNLLPCKQFADIGCDHGYCTAYMLTNALCKNALITDISAKSLRKAEILLDEFLKSGQLKSICTNGLKNIPPHYDQVLIAGMGGEEIISILCNGYLPEKLLLQPMKNTKKLREFLLQNGYAIHKDFTFFDKKYYDLLFAVKNAKQKRQYTALDLLFGYDNMHSPTQEFWHKILYDIAKYEKLAGQQSIDIKLSQLYEVQNEIRRNLSKN